LLFLIELLADEQVYKQKMFQESDPAWYGFVLLVIHHQGIKIKIFLFF